MSIIACVGTRALPRYMHGQLESAGMYYVEQGHTLISGNAVGTDQAYQLGGSIADATRVIICLPWDSYENKAIIPGNQVLHAGQAAYEERELAQQASLHDWSRMKSPMRLLFIRNAMIASRCTDTVFANPNVTRIGWGGTGHTMRCAALLNKKVWLVMHQRWWNIHEGTPIER